MDDSLSPAVIAQVLDRVRHLQGWRRAAIDAVGDALILKANLALWSEFGQQLYADSIERLLDDAWADAPRPVRAHAMPEKLDSASYCVFR